MFDRQDKNASHDHIPRVNHIYIYLRERGRRIAIKTYNILIYLVISSSPGKFIIQTIVCARSLNRQPLFCYCLEDNDKKKKMPSEIRDVEYSISLGEYNMRYYASSLRRRSTVGGVDGCF